MELAELQRRAAAATPMSLGSVPVLQGRTLHLDGDGLAYYCAGNDETLLGEARERLADKVRAMQVTSGSGRSNILLTASGSHKGYRYAIARIKPYQGQRSNSRRPKNWQGLRDMLIDGYFGDHTVATAVAEADDLFGYHGHRDPEHTVIGTQDKDMRMVPGWHIDWVSNLLCYVPPDTYDLVFNDKQFGRKWFWLQMLHGDTADFIPGLPRIGGKDAKGKPTLKQCGPETAASVLAGTKSNDEAAEAVYAAYRSYYKDRWLVEMLEQAALLWMRRDEHSSWDDCARQGGPMAYFIETDEWLAAYREIGERVTTVESYKEAAQD